MSELLKIRYENDLVVISLNNPPINLITRPLRVALIEKLEEVQTDQRVKAIVLWAQGRMFSMGADLGEINDPDQHPSLARLCSAIEASQKPVIAALHGAALGAGLEVAMAAHGRIATAQCSLGMPEIKLGLTPSAGGTQRLARLCGAENALNILTRGSSTIAKKAQAWGLVDRVSQEDLWDEAQDLALELAAKPLLRTRDLSAGKANPSAYQASVSKARAAANGPLAAVKTSLCQLIEAAQILPFDAGMAMEAATYETFKGSRKSVALRYILAAERQMNAPSRQVKPVSILAIYGDGPQSAMLIIEALEGGMNVLAHGLGDATYGIISQNLHSSGRVKMKTEDQTSQILTRLVRVENVGDFDEADIVIDATRSNGADIAKRYPIPRDGVIKPFGFFNPARDIDRLNELMGDHGNVVKLLTPPIAALEVLTGNSTKTATVGAFQSFSNRLGRIGVPSREPARKPLMQAQTRAVIWMLKHGASVTQIDQALVQFGYRTGPFQRMDIDGIAKIQAQFNRKLADPFWVALVDRMCASGRVGTTSGRGFYDYDEQGRVLPAADDFVTGLANERQAIRAPQLNWSKGQIQLRDMAALLSQGCSLLGRQAVRRASDIDVLAVGCMWFPRWRGGPMKASQAHGLVAMQLALRNYAKDDDTIWADSPVLSEAIKTSQGFETS